MGALKPRVRQLSDILSPNRSPHSTEPSVSVTPKIDTRLHCKQCTELEEPERLKNGLCSKCAWQCPSCENWTLKPDNDYVCFDCR